MPILKRLTHVMESLHNYGNPLGILWARRFSRSGEMAIADRKTGVSVRALRDSYPMFAETWYQRDYDVAGCPIRRGDVVIDVGANQGFFTCYAAQRGAHVYSFEPNPRTFELLNENVRRNGFSDHVISQCVAISDCDGDAELKCYSHHDGWDTISAERDQIISRVFDDMRRIPVKVRRLASMIPRNQQVRLLKLDCEGAELAILNDFESIEHFDSLAVEFHSGAYRIEALIERLLAFQTHQVYSLHGHIVHAIRSESLLEFAKSMNGSFLADEPEKDKYFLPAHS